MERYPGRFWFSMYSLMIDSGAPPHNAAKRDGNQKWAPRRYRRMWL
ncbi:hypothetical protein [Streptomyces sp. WM4235]|nr:hypothetical protein [Streptomyces sp. WM4235]